MKFRIKMISFALALLAVCCFSGCSGSANDADTLLRMAAKSAQDGKNSDALMLAKEACMVSPDNVEALLMRSVMAERCNDKLLALDSALQALKRAPNRFAPLYTVGRLYAQDKKTAAEAMGYLEKAHNLMGDDVNTLILLANLAVTLKSEKALTYLLKIENADSSLLNTFEGQTLLGHAYNIRGDKRNAVIAFGKADRLGKNILSNYNYAVAADCLYNKPNFALPKYQAFLKQTAADIEYSSLRKDVERRLKKITPKKRSRRR
ncbi:MAG: hypothetical protein IKB77_03840 [Lentisphaeria bacterium]|nr:hypothetical protein [Lentisphaeria bacterium]